MRKFVIAFFAFVLMFVGMSAIAYATNCFKEKETLIDRTGDWFATRGKNAKEKERILVKRKRDRIKECTQKNLESGPRGKMS